MDDGRGERSVRSIGRSNRSINPTAQRAVSQLNRRRSGHGRVIRCQRDPRDKGAPRAIHHFLRLAANFLAVVCKRGAPAPRASPMGPTKHRMGLLQLARFFGNGNRAAHTRAQKDQLAHEADWGGECRAQTRARSNMRLAGSLGLRLGRFGRGYVAARSIERMHT